MLLPREKKMIELIYRSKNGLTTFELANALNISQRTVKYELQKIKEELKSSGCRIDSKTGRGIWSVKISGAWSGTAAAGGWPA